jgi:hypothetical protein
MARANAKVGAKRRNPITLAASTGNVARIVAGDVRFARESDSRLTPDARLLKRAMLHLVRRAARGLSIDNRAIAPELLPNGRGSESGWADCL